jgi:Ca2+-binding RTX toxin-like protein
VNYALGANSGGVTNLVASSTMYPVSLVGNSAANSISGNDTGNTLAGGGGNDTIVGGSGNDLIFAGSQSYSSTLTGSVSLVSGGGNNTLVSGAGVATMVGGTGDNTYYVNNSADVVKQTTQGGGVGTVITSVSYDMGKQAVGVTNLNVNSTTGVKITGNALADSITGGTGNDSLIAGAGGSTLQAFGQQGGAQPGGSSEADMMTGGSGADSFVLGNQSGSFYLDSGGYKPGDASYAGINNFDLSKDQLVLSGSQGGYSAVFFSDIKAANTGSDLTTFNQEIAAFTARTGITPSNKDIMLYHGDITAGNADFIAGIHTTTTAGSADDVLTKATFV